MSAQPEAMRLADALWSNWFTMPSNEVLETAAAELRRLAAVEAQRDALLEALKEITPSMPPVDAPCHYGIVPQEKCGHCGRIAKARAAIKAVEEQT